MKELFRKMAHTVSEAVGSPWAFLAAAALIVGWAASGPLFGYSETWQLVVNTATTIVTFLMVFLIQNTQNRDSKAIHLKLDELLRALKDARTGMVDLEDMSDDELARLQDEFKRLRESNASLVADDLEAVEGELGERRKGQRRPQKSTAHSQ